MSSALRRRELLGRDRELLRVGAFLEQVGRGSGAAGLVLEGEAGIGKTELWRVGVESGSVHGLRVLSARPAQAERELAFAGLADLLASARQEIARLPEPQRRPLSVALLFEEAGVPADGRAIAVAVLELLRVLARRSPVLVAIDDVQWLDRASAAALAFALRRATRERVGVFLARRSEVVTRLELDRTMPVERIVLGPLSLRAVVRLIREQFAFEFSFGTLRRIHERSGGNPFYALELARALERRGEQAPAGGEWPLPQDLSRLVGERMAALPLEAREPLAAVAALGEPAAALVAGSESLDAAFAAGVLVHEGDRVRFAHPLLAAAAYDALPPSRRHVLHRRLAEIVDDSEQRARHLALGSHKPDPELGAMLEEAAAHAHARGAPDAAADLVERALAFDPAADPAVAARRVASAAQYHVLAGDDRRARQLLEEALGEAEPGPPRAQLLRGLALCAENVDVGGAIGALEAALREARGHPRLEAEILGLLAYWPGARGVIEDEALARAAVAAAETVDDPALLARSLSSLACSEFAQGRGAPSSELVERVLALEQHCDLLPVAQHPVTAVGWIRLRTGEIDESRALLEQARAVGESRGDSTVTDALYQLCFVELFADKWSGALELADALCDAGADTERDELLVQALATRAAVLAHMGDEAGVRRDVAAASVLDTRSDPERFLPWLASLSLLELSLGRPEAALESARRQTSQQRAAGIEEPGMLFSFPLHAEAAIAVGNLGEAEELLDWIDERAVRLDRAWALACVARCRGTAAAVRGDEPTAAEAFERALAQHERLQYRRFELARTLLAQGESLRRFKRKRQAREAIGAALAIFDELGAALWKARAESDLARISGRRSVGGLTETERRVAELVAAGLSNKEVARDLFVTVRTVEWTLTNVYRKLGVRSRTELASRLSP